jgi:hypothetical protein
MLEHLGGCVCARGMFSRADPSDQWGFGTRSLFFVWGSWEGWDGEALAPVSVPSGKGIRCEAT